MEYRISLSAQAAADADEVIIRIGEQYTGRGRHWNRINENPSTPFRIVSLV